MGEHGGKLSAIVAASEAELGAKAQSAGTAEWVRKGRSLRVYLPHALSAPSEAKWIVMGGKVSKPVVVKAPRPPKAPSVSFPGKKKGY